MHISLIDPITPAWNHMVRILFRPFAFKKWMLLGFCAFLAQCGEGAASSNSTNWSNPNNRQGFDSAKQWIESNMELVIGVAIGTLTLAIVIGLLVTWLSSRGKFMLLDGIVKNRGAVSEPWTEFKTEANSLFLFRIVVGLIALVGFLVAAGVPVLIALPDFKSGTFSGASFAAIAFGCFLLIPYIIACGAFSFFVRVFVVPTMYLKRVRAVEGMGIAWQSLCKGHLGSAVLLGLMMFLLGIVSVVFALIATCATCCITALPYIGSVILLPISVFFVCYSITYIQQFGDDWQFLAKWCDSCGYEREGLKTGQACPECGVEPRKSE
jgi:hypothetical protein